MLSWLFSKPLSIGESAPHFTLPDQDGNSVKLADLLGTQVVVVFYPRNETPTCTQQLCEFRDQWEAVTEAGARIFGINPQSAEAHIRFKTRHRLPFPLLVDSGGTVATLYHAGGPIIRRTVYGIDKAGRICFARRGKPLPVEVLRAFSS